MENIIAKNLFWVGVFLILGGGAVRTICKRLKYISKCLGQKLRNMNSNIRKHELKKAYVIRVSYIKA